MEVWPVVAPREIRPVSSTLAISFSLEVKLARAVTSRVELSEYLARTLRECLEPFGQMRSFVGPAVPDVSGTAGPTSTDVRVGSPGEAYGVPCWVQLTS